MELYSRRFFCWCAVWLGLAAMVRAQAAEPAAPDPVVAKLDESVGRFFEGVAKGDVAKSYADLLKDSQLLRQADAVKSLVDKTKDLEKRFGKYRGYDRVDAKRVGKDLILVRYIYKCDDFPVVWYLSFYRDFKHSDADNSAWIVVSVRFDTDLELLGM
ncbi:MAG TPA: hypothetical protein VFE24_13770 [Pirellulales bacterium]|nr:hypothetical protein [Pirellulales bacterium]